MLRFRLPVVAFLLLSINISCAPDPGSVRLAVDWGLLKSAKNVYLWLRVEERTNPDKPGVTLSSAGPELQSTPWCRRGRV